MVASPAGWMQQRALRGSGRPARLAADYLCRRYRRAAQRYVDVVVRLMCHARDEQVAHRARVTLEESWSYQPTAREAIWYSIQRVMKAAEAEHEAHLRDGNDVPWLVTLAVLTDRPDRAGRYDQRELAGMLLATMAEPQPRYVAEGCRRILRALPEGDGREWVCQQAQAGDLEARAAATDAGYLPTGPDEVPVRPPAPRRPADSRSGNPQPYVPGGTATSGTGGFTVHGV